MGSGLIISGRAELVPGLVVQNYIDNHLLRLASGDRRMRAAKEKVCAVVVHTTKGIPGGKDLRPQVIKPGVGPSSRAGEHVVSTWTLDTKTAAGAHLIVDYDGRVYCCADLALEAAYHAGLANGASVGIEMMQGMDACLYEGQLAATVTLVEHLCLRFGILHRIPDGYHGPRPMLMGRLDGISGVFGHRDLTANRGAGDPGDAVMERLAGAGFQRAAFQQADQQNSG
jgi:hypothetical protein